MMTPQMLKGVLPIVVLWSLADDDAYGYAILRRLRDSGFTGVGDASVYGTLQRHHESGFVSSYLGDGGQGPARRYYTLTPPGRLALERSRQDWHALVRAVAALVPPEQAAPAPPGQEPIPPEPVDHAQAAHDQVEQEQHA